MSTPAQVARITVLPGILVNQIAAGEVIERPASVVKELTENSIDAGATRIDIEIEAGGSDAIIVRDNGSGIHPDDLELAVMRHTTSKLRTREDLDAICTLGFRGEALSSIASISRFTIITRAVDHELARRLTIDPVVGTTELAPAARTVGTTIEVRNLFYNVPARRKFLRSERTEFLHILDMVRNLVMSRPDIHIQLRHNGKTVLNCPAVTADFRDRFQSVLGSSFDMNSRAIETAAGPMHLFGWMGEPAAARSQSDQQYFYLNRRMVRDRQITHAIRMAMEPELPPARFPAYVLYLKMDPALVDVNVHPTKQEVRFRHPRDVHDFIFAALRERPAPAPDRQTSASVSISSSSRLRETPSIYQAAVSVNSKTEGDAHPFGVPVAIINPVLVVVLYNDALRIIDFAKLRAGYLIRLLSDAMANEAVQSRPLLVPVSFKLPVSMMGPLLDNADTLALAGVQIEQTGPQSIRVRTLPALLPDLELEPLLREFAALIARQGSAPVHTQSLIQLMVQHAGGGLSGYTLTQIADQLRRFAADGVIPDADRAGLWRTLSATELQTLLNG